MADVIESVLAAKKLEDLVPAPVEKPDTKPNLTTTRVNNAIEKLKDIELNGGYGDIAASVGLNKGQVKEIHAKMKEKIVELSPCGVCGKNPCECPPPIEEKEVVIEAK